MWRFIRWILRLPPPCEHRFRPIYGLWNGARIIDDVRCTKCGKPGLPEQITI